MIKQNDIRSSLDMSDDNSSHMALCAVQCAVCIACMASHHASSPVSMRRLPGAGAIFIEPKTSSRYWQALIATILAR